MLYRPLSQCVANNYYLLLCIIILNFLFTWQKDEFSEELVTVQKEERKGQEAREAVIKDKAEEQKQQVSLICFVLTRTLSLKRLCVLLESFFLFSLEASLKMCVISVVLVTSPFFFLVTPLPSIQSTYSSLGRVFFCLLFTCLCIYFSFLK